MNFDRFLRYTIPGLVAILFFYFLTKLHDPSDKHNILQPEISLGYIAGLVFVTGGLGAIFNIVYWAFCHFIRYPLNHVQLLISLRHKLRIVDGNGNEIPSVGRRDAWSIFNSYWYSKTNLRQKLKAINPRVDRLSDVTHGTGTIIAGLCLTFCYFIYRLFQNITFSWVPIIAGFLFIAVTFFNYIRLLGMYQALLNTTFATILDEDLNERKSKDSKVTFIEIILIR
jgi:hypothetical protein